MPKEKPLVGVTCHYLDENACRGIATAGQDGSFIAGDYVYRVEEAGGVPVLLPLCLDPETLLPVLARLDGLLVTGGGDVTPALYGAEPSPYCGKVSAGRDAQDLFLARYALSHDLPLLGICRGMQVLNVAAGGTLWQDLESEGRYACHRGAAPRNLPRHTVRLAEGSLLRSIYGKEIVAVNTFHHQAVKEPAPGAAVTATSGDGVIEGLEFAGHAFAAAVQWHPEKMFDSDEQALLFRAFVRACESESRRTDR